MGLKPDFDPNSYAEYDADIINRNLPIWMSFEPGSTFKVRHLCLGIGAGSLRYVYGYLL